MLGEMGSDGPSIACVPFARPQAALQPPQDAEEARSDLSVGQRGRFLAAQVGFGVVA